MLSHNTHQGDEPNECGAHSQPNPGMPSADIGYTRDAITPFISMQGTNKECALNPPHIHIFCDDMVAHLNARVYTLDIADAYLQGQSLHGSQHVTSSESERDEDEDEDSTSSESSVPPLVPRELFDSSDDDTVSSGDTVRTNGTTSETESIEPGQNWHVNFIDVNGSRTRIDDESTSNEHTIADHDSVFGDYPPGGIYCQPSRGVEPDYDPNHGPTTLDPHLLHVNQVNLHETIREEAWGERSQQSLSDIESTIDPDSDSEATPPLWDYDSDGNAIFADPYPDSDSDSDVSSYPWMRHRSTSSDSTEDGEYVDSNDGQDSEEPPLLIQSWAQPRSDDSSSDSSDDDQEQHRINYSAFNSQMGRRRRRRQVHVRNSRNYGYEALNDRGANGSIIAKGMAIGDRTDRYIDVTGIQNHTVGELNIVEGICVARSTIGDTVIHIPEGAHMPDGKTILSSIQMEHNGCKVIDVAPEANKGKPPHIISPEGYIFPMSIRQGLPILDIRPPLEGEMNDLPHVYLTGNSEWDPSRFDSEAKLDAFSQNKDDVEQHFQEMPYTQDGRVKEVDESVSSSEERDHFTRAEIHANLTQMVQDDLVDSVIEIRVDDQIYHRDLDGYDETCDWGEWESHTHHQRYSYDVEGRPRRPRRNTKPVDYSETRRKTTGKTNDRSPQAISDLKRAERGESLNDHHGESDTTEEEESDMDHSPRTDYNNPARSTLQNEKREAHGGPLVGKPSEIQYEKFAKFFGGVPETTIEKTFQNTTQLGRIGAVKGLKLWKRHKAPNPALNVGRRNEPVATDTVYGPTPAVDNGSTAAQLFVGRKSSFASVEGLGRSDKDYPVALMHHIRKYGAMDVIVSDSAAAELSKRVQSILNIYGIKQWSSEPHNKNQNYAEREWRDIKRMVEHILNHSDAPMIVWLLALEYVCFIRNHTARERLGWRTPTEWLLGFTPDITVMLIFHFWEPVYYAANEAEWPADTREALGMFVGISECVGNAVTFKILTKSMKVISRSVVRSASGEGIFQNERANAKATEFAPSIPNHLVRIKNNLYPVNAKTIELQEMHTDDRKPAPIEQGTEQLWKEEERKRQAFPMRVETISDEDSDQDDEDTESEDELPSIIDPENVANKIRLRTLHEKRVLQGNELPTLDSKDLIGRTFITTPDHNGEQLRAQIESIEATDERTPDRREVLFKFRCKVGDQRFDEVMAYNRMLDWIEHDQQFPASNQVSALCGHRKHNNEWQVLVLWASGKRTWLPFDQLWEDDHVSLAMYARKHGLLDLDKWRKLRPIAKKAKTLGRMMNQVRLKNFRNKPVYKYGVQVPRSHAEAMLIDEKNGDHRWAESEALEMSQLMEYDSFESFGIGAPVPKGYKKIPCHFVYDIKASGKFKSRMVAGGHRTDTPIDSVYSGVVSLQGVRVVTFLAELNDLELWGTDVGNAYLESYTTEKVAFIAGQEFGEYAGHTMLIRKAQYGLKSSGKCWHDKLHDILRNFGFTPSKADEDVWMRKQESHYEYIAVYVDDLLIASKNPQAIIDYLTEDPVNFKLKGTGPLTFHLGCDYFRDDEGTLCVGPRKYIERMIDSYTRMFGKPPTQNVQSPLDKNDHPELDDSPLLEVDDIAKYQSLIGTLQWTISLGRFDIATAVMSMSGFRVAPREGHLIRVRRICGYLAKFRNACIRVRTEIPDYSDIVPQHYDWARTAYGGAKEVIPQGTPEPLGREVVLTTYKDANLYHDMTSGKAVTGILHFLNQTPIEWYSKKQATCETATYGAEFSAARSAIEQIAGLRHFLRYLGVPIKGCAYLFGDNESVVTSSTVPQSQLRKRHQALSYHYTREAIASGMVRFTHLPSEANPSDVLSKHWSHSQVYQMLRPLLFYKGDTMDLIDPTE